MKMMLYPAKETWRNLCVRPDTENSVIDETVKTILNDIKTSGDNALYEYTMKYDRVKTRKIKVSQEEIHQSGNRISKKVKEAIDIAYKNIEKFHRIQLNKESVIETTPGIKCWRRNVPVEKVGFYIPGGSAPLFSSVLMLGIPANIAGCGQIVMCTPPGTEGNINPLILYAAFITGITDIFSIGGAQAIGAMAFGTETVPQVYKIIGPGNIYVTKAKEIVQTEGVAIDMPAGPSEVLIIADDFADPEFVAADLLSQAEHGTGSQVVLLTNSRNTLQKVISEVEKQLPRLPRHDIASQALENSIFLLLGSLEECLEFSNMYAPEHLVLNISEAPALAEKVINAGSVFIGKYSCESAGDYASGTNHTLPTNGYAKYFSGVSVDTFLKKITFQEITREGIERIGPAIEIMADAEGLTGHKNAVTVRLQKIRND